MLRCWVVRHKSRGNRPMGKQGISEQQNQYFCHGPPALCTYHPLCVKCPTPIASTWPIPLPLSGLDPLSPFRRGRYCLLISTTAVLPDLPALTSFLSHAVSKSSFPSDIMYVLHLLVYCLAPPTSKGGDFAFSVSCYAHSTKTKVWHVEGAR